MKGSPDTRTPFPWRQESQAQGSARASCAQASLTGESLAMKLKIPQDAKPGVVDTGDGGT